MQFEWDERKGKENLKKHHVSFEEARTVFRDPLARIFADEQHSGDESREIIIGHSILSRLILVCFTERRDRIRVLSARTVTARERKDYEQNTTP